VATPLLSQFLSQVSPGHRLGRDGRILFEQRQLAAAPVRGFVQQGRSGNEDTVAADCFSRYFNFVSWLCILLLMFNDRESRRMCKFFGPRKA
jgi:hypothetical protein